jgi:hypothetical protein
MQWLQDTNQSDTDNVKTVGREASRLFKIKKRGNIGKEKLMNLKQTIRTRKLQICRSSIYL